jgi:DNA repair exonuclease SbcCD ATPase subunit
MNAQVKELAITTELEQVTTAVTAMSRVEAGLTALRAKHSGIVFDVTTTAGMESAKEARREIREPRLEVERVRKAAKAPLLALGKQLDTTAARITAELEKLEDPIDSQIKAEESRKEREREAKVQAELARVASIQERIAELRGNQALSPSSGYRLIADHISDLTAIPVDATFDEFEQQASDAKVAGLARLHAILKAAIEHEAEQEKIRLEREELAKLRAEAAEREAKAAQERAQVEAAAKAERDREAAEAKAKADAEAARVAEENRLERERIAKERAENERIAREAREKAEAEAKAERDRIAAEEAALKAVRDLEAAALAAERAEFDRQRAEAAAKAEAARLAAEEAARPKPRKKRSAMPTKEIILQVLVDHFEQPEEVIAGWLSIYFGSAA